MPLISVYNTGTNKTELLNTDCIARVTPRTIDGGSAVYMANGGVILVAETITDIQLKELKL